MKFYRVVHVRFTTAHLKPNVVDEIYVFLSRKIELLEIMLLSAVPLRN